MNDEVFKQFPTNENKSQFLGDMYSFLKNFEKKMFEDSATPQSHEVFIMENFLMYFQREVINSFLYILNSEKQDKKITTIPVDFLKSTYEKFTKIYEEHFNIKDSNIRYSTHVKATDSSFIKYICQDFPKLSYQEFRKELLSSDKEINEALISSTVEYNLSLFLLVLNRYYHHYKNDGSRTL